MLNNIFCNFFSGTLASTSIISNEDLQSLERFLVLLYDRTNNCANVNWCRRELFPNKARAFEIIPATFDALKLHIKRASLQTK